MKICFPDHDIIELINFILDSFNQSNGVPNFFIYLSIAFDNFDHNIPPKKQSCRLILKLSFKKEAIYADRFYKGI